MTEFWKSNAMHWCDICKCWMNDTKQARLNHERGSTHQARLEKKLRDMARKAEDEVKAKEAATAAMSKIEQQAAKKFEKDRAAAAAERVAAAEAMGRWTWDAESKYYYNAVYRWYYDPATKWYYGGEPTPEWAQAPPLPAAAMFGAAPHEGGPVPVGAAATHGSAGTGAAPAGGGGAAAAGVAVTTVKRVIAVPKHPLAGLGGYKAPTSGQVGGGMGADRQVESEDGAPKRKREEPGKGKGAAAAAVSAEEAAALARREAARQRVAQRTAAGFGYL